MNKLLAMALVALSVAAVGCGRGAESSAQQAGARESQHATDYELYSWQVPNNTAWHFALLPLVKEPPPASKIVEPANDVAGADALRARLDRLPKGSSVSWFRQPKAFNNTPTDATFGYPSRKIVDEVGYACQARGVRLLLEQGQAPTR